MFGIPPKLIDVVLNLMLKMPNLIFDLLQLKFDAFCKAVFDAEPFGPFDGSKCTTWMASQIVLTRKTAECVVINVTGSTVGSSSGGITGQEGLAFGYTPPPPPAGALANIRDKIVQTANDAAGYAWSNDKKALSDGKAEEVKYMQLLWPFNVEENRNGTSYDMPKMWSLLNSIKEISSCGVFARSCLRNGGAQGTNYTTKLNPGQSENAYDAVFYDAERTGALKHFSASEMPALKAGDIIHVCLQSNRQDSGHMLVVTSDWGGGMGNANVSQVAGGQTDTGVPESEKAFAIGAGTISTFGADAGQAILKYDGNDSLRYINKIIDSEILVKGTRSST
jgi:hypothetical protein